MYQDWLELIHQLNTFSVFLRLLLAILCGGAIGIERGRKRRPAGLRTYMLVCLGSALVMITNQYIAGIYHLADPARLGAQVISGIGFLGAGTIIVTRHHQVIGLTTAAGLWASACMGLAIGVGFYSGAILSCLFILFIIIIMHRLDNRVVAKSKVIDIYVEMAGKQIGDLLQHLSGQGIRVSHLEMVKVHDKNTADTAALMTLRLPKPTHHVEVLDSLRRVECITFVEEV